MTDLLSAFFVFTLTTLVFTFFTRLFIRIVINSVLNRSAYKKLIKNQSFREWLLCSRFRGVIPNVFLLWYFGNFALCLIFLAASAVIVYFRLSFSLIALFLIFNVIILVPHIIVEIMFGTSKKKGAYNISRWIGKKKNR